MTTNIKPYNGGGVTNLHATVATKADLNPWVFKSYCIVASSSLTISANDTITYDLSDILPDDEFNYEITFRTVFNVSAAVQYCVMYCYTDLSPSSDTYCLCRFQNISTTYVGLYGGSIIAVVGTGRTLSVLSTVATTFTLFEIHLKGYRKIS